jgi:hypothetical protein
MDSVLDLDAVVAAHEVCRRSGATDFEIGHLDDGPIDKARWWAKANYGGDRVLVEDRAGPDEAATALVRRVLDGAHCACGLHALTHPTLIDRARHALRPSTARCLWQRYGRHWIPGCVDVTEEVRRIEREPARPPRRLPEADRRIVPAPGDDDR